MNRQSFSMRQDEDLSPLSIGSSEADFYTNQAMDNQMFPVAYGMDPIVFQQQYNLTTSFESYAQTSCIDPTQVWATPQQQNVDPPSQSPIQQGLPPLVPQLSIAKSLVSDDGDDTSEPHSPRDEASERRKERRRAQNRAAQRAFRARKESTIKESSARLEAMQEELVRLQSANGNLSDTVGRFRTEIARLQAENAALGGRRDNKIAAWEYAQDDECNSKETVGSARPSLEKPEERGISFDLNGGMIGTLQWQDTASSKGGGAEDKSVAETVVDAAPALTRRIF